MSYESDDVDRMLGCLVEPAVADLAARLRSVPVLDVSERQALTSGLATSLREVVWRQVRRVVLVELHTARLTGQLTAADTQARWREWMDMLARPGGWQQVAAPYPELMARLHTLITSRCAAGYALAARFSRDRSALARLLPSGAGPLTHASFGAGDSHHGGQSVAVLRLSGGTVVYKPRPLEVDRVLGRLLLLLLADEPEPTRIRVPTVLPREDAGGRYGWAEHVAHRYCDTDVQLRYYYRGLGHWLAVMRMLGGSDLHAENVIAAGPVPVVVDCETLFAPHHAAVAEGYGAAVVRAVDLLGMSVLRTGLLPGRGAVLGWGDASAAGSLPDQQPPVRVPTIIDPGTDRARLGMTAARPRPPQTNLPRRAPDLGRYWEHVVEGFTELTRRLQDLDRAGALEPALTGFAHLDVRVVLRDTAMYAELINMLWHPSSLFEPAPARARAAELLARQARNRPGTPDDPAVIDAEVAELLDGDVPVFTTTPADGVLTGPRGTRWGQPRDLVEAALRRWRASDLATDQQVIRATLVGAYLNDEFAGRTAPAVATSVRTDRLDLRRRRQAAMILQQLSHTAIRGNDGTVTWIAPTLDRVGGWTVRSTTPDLYNGHAGIAVVLAGYVREVSRDRADPVPGLDTLLAAVVRTLEVTEDQQAAERALAAADGMAPRPEPPGGYLGLGSRIWSWLLLHRLGAVSADRAGRRAEALAELLPAAVAADQAHDLLAGSAGALVPLLRLAEHTGQARWRQLAREIGQRLADHAVRVDAGSRWLPAHAEIPTLGIAHGAAGIGWALTRLAHATGESALWDLATAAFSWTESHYDQHRRGWRDPRRPDEAPLHSWCHGGPGIGLCAADLLAAGSGPLPAEAAERWRDVLARAAGSVWPEGLKLGLTLCHGSLSCWEVLDRAWRCGVAPPDLDRELMVARIVGTIEENGPATGITREVFQPGLLVGSGGVAYQLLRMDTASDLPSVALPDPALPTLDPLQRMITAMDHRSAVCHPESSS